MLAIACYLTAYSWVIEWSEEPMWIIQYESNLMVSRHAGTLPVLLTSPHGAPATAKPPGVSERTGSTPGCPPNKILGDTFTRQITTAVAQLLLETLGEAPYVVIADYHRKFIDANRDREMCLQSF